MSRLREEVHSRLKLVRQFSAAALAKLGRPKTKENPEPKRLAVCSPERWEELTQNDPQLAAKLVIIARNARLLRAWRKNNEKDEEEKPQR